MLNKDKKIAVCVMAKQPIPGAVKTRLIPAIGAEGAARLAQAFLQDTMRCVSQLDWARPGLASTNHSVVSFQCEVWEQGEGDLGARQENVLMQALATSRAAILIGADCPGLPVSRLESARDALEKSDAVLGPSHDGGYYLIGLKRCTPGLLSGVRWSQPDTCIQVISKLRTWRLRVTIIDRWFDVDTPEDLAGLAARIHTGEISVPYTAMALRSVLRNTPEMHQVRAHPANSEA